MVLLKDVVFFFFKQKTAYEMRISDWRSDVCSSDLQEKAAAERRAEAETSLRREWGGDHERNLTFAQRAVRSFGDDTFVDFLESQEVEGVKLGDHPAFVRAFAAIGRAMGEDQPTTGAGERGGGRLKAEESRVGE